MARSLFEAHFERGGPADYVQLKDLAALLRTHHLACHARMCFKPGTLVASNEALAAALSEAGVEVRLGNVTLPGGKQARGVVRGYRMSSTDDTLRASEQRAQEVRWACPHGVSWRA